MKNTLNRPILVGSLLTAAMFAGSAQAALVAQYTFTDLTTSDVDTNTSATALTRGAGLTGKGTFDSTTAPTVSGDMGTVPSTPSFKFDFADVGSSQANALANDEYLSFTVTSTGGATIDFTNITLDFAKGARAVGDKSGKAIGVHIYAGDFSVLAPTAADFIGTGRVPGGKDSSDLWYGIDIDLAAITATTSPTEFRLYLEDAGAGNRTHKIWVDSIALNATVTPIPEPSSTALLGLGGLALILRRRK